MPLTWQGRTVINRVLWVLSIMLMIAGIVLLAKGAADARSCRNQYYTPCYRAAQQQGLITSRNAERYYSNYCTDLANSKCHLSTSERYTYVGGALFAAGFILTVCFCFCGGANYWQQDVVVTTTHIPQQGIVMQQGPMYQPQYVQQPQYGQPQYVQQPQYGQPQYGQPTYGQPIYGDPAQPQFGQPATGYPGQEYPPQPYAK